MVMAKPNISVGRLKMSGAALTKAFIIPNPIRGFVFLLGYFVPTIVIVPMRHQKYPATKNTHPISEAPQLVQQGLFLCLQRQ
jgi:hypothetical protein